MFPGGHSAFPPPVCGCFISSGSGGDGAKEEELFNEAGIGSQRRMLAEEKELHNGQEAPKVHCALGKHPGISGAP